MHTLKKPLTAVFTAALLLGLTGCDEQKTGGTTVMITTERSNQPTVDLNSPAIRELNAKIRQPGAKIYVVTADTAPKVVDTSFVRADDTAPEFARGIDKTTLEKSKATKPEADMYEALAVAARTLQNTGDEGSITVFDNALSTTGLLDARTLANANDPALVAKNIPSLKLDGINITWYGACTAVAPQEHIPATACNNIQDGLRAFIELSGGTVTFEGTPMGSAAPNADLPAVTPLTFAQANNGCGTVKLDNKRIEFAPNSATLKNPEVAKQQLTELAKQLGNTNCSAVKVAGSTARFGNPTSSKKLSKERAQVVADHLKEAGLTLPMTVEGHGWEHPLATNDGGPNALQEDLAQRNRFVSIDLK